MKTIEEIEKEMKDWQNACNDAIKRREKESHDYFIKAKIYDRNVKHGIYKITEVPVKKGMKMLNDFVKTKIDGEKKRASEKD